VERNAKIYVAGHRGLVGSALVRRLRAQGYENLLLRTRSELDLTRQEATENFFSEERPEYVFLAAAKVGGIGANSAFGADFIRDNLAIQTHILDCAHRYGVKKLLFLGSSCIYPRNCPQPIREEYLLTGPLEPTNEPYAIAKIAGLIACKAYRRQYGCDFVAVMPTNLYGPGDNDDPETAHVLPALIRKFVEAKRDDLPAVTLWGTGTPRREFLHVDDLASACLFLMERYSGEIALNVGTGEDLTIAELARLIADQVGYGGRILWDSSKPDGTPRKLLEVSRIRGMGWKARIGLEEGVKGILGDDETDAK
jgi:GDP-L-fucose synthase